MLSNLKLRGRILLGYAIPIPLFALLAWMVTTNTGMVKESLIQANAVRDANQLTDQIEADLCKMESATRGYLLSKKTTYFNNFQEANKELEEKIANTLKIVKNSDNNWFEQNQKKRIDEIVVISKQIRSQHLKMIAMAQKTDNDSEAHNIFNQDNSNKLLLKIKLLNQQFDEDSIKKFQISESKINTSMEWLNGIAKIGTIIAGAGAIVIGILLASRIRQQINQAVETIAASATEIASTMEQQERTCVQQATYIHQTTTSMDELAAASRTTVGQAETAVNGANRTLKLIDKNSQNIITSNTKAEVTLQEKVEEIVAQINQLNQQVNQIKTIANSVSDLANQTNMLALNAAVESVRAGTQGKGFGVVANEIRKLADQSKKSAEKINDLLITIQSFTHATVLATEAGEKTLENVVIAINDIVISSQQISLTAKQQAIAIEQVLAAINNINQDATQTATSISQTKIGMQNLNKVALNLKTLV